MQEKFNPMSGKPGFPNSIIEIPAPLRVSFIIGDDGKDSHGCGHSIPDAIPGGDDAGSAHPGHGGLMG